MLLNTIIFSLSISLTSSAQLRNFDCKRTFKHIMKKRGIKKSEPLSKPEDIQKTIQLINNLLKDTKSEQIIFFLNTLKEHIEFLEQSKQINKKILLLFNQYLKVIENSLQKPQVAEAFLTHSEKIQLLLKTKPEHVNATLSLFSFMEDLIKAKNQEKLREIKIQKFESILFISAIIISLGTAGYFYFFPEEFNQVKQLITEMISIQIKS